MKKTITGILIKNLQVQMDGDVVMIPVDKERYNDFINVGYAYINATEGLGDVIAFDPKHGGCYGGLSDGRYPELKGIHDDWIRNKKLGKFLSKLS